MESSLRSFKLKSKLYKMKNSLDSYIRQNLEYYKLETPNKFQKNHQFKILSTDQVSSSTNQFSGNLSSLAFGLSFPKKIGQSKEFSDQNLYEPLSLSQKRNNNKFRCKTGKSLSYKNQREQSTIKTQIALNDLKQIGQFKINQFQGFNNTIGFNEECKSQQQICVFQTYETIQNDKPRAIRSPSKSRSIIGKRAQTSPKKLRNWHESQRKSPKKATFRIKQCENIQPLCAPPLLSKKSSISAWQTSSQIF